MWIVQLALRRTYTFVVAAVLIVAVSVVAVRRMPVDNFPNIDIPVVTAVYLYGGMPADDIEKRILLVTERVLTASVNDIEHIESQAYNGVGVIRIYFQPNAKIEAGVAQVTATCQTVLSIMPQARPRRTSSATARLACRSCRSRSPATRSPKPSSTTTRPTSSSGGSGRCKVRGCRSRTAASRGRSWWTWTRSSCTPAACPP